MRAKAATLGDLEAVFTDLSRRIANDYASSGIESRAAKDALVMNLKEGRAHALIEGGRPLAVIAWHEAGGAVHTQFAAQESFFEASNVRFCMKHIRRIQALAGNLTVQHRSGLRSSKVSKWFRILGFEERSPESGLIVFELPPV